MANRIVLFFSLICFSVVLLSFLPKPQLLNSSKPIKTIIIDAGHGGQDGGARGTYSSEKDICLAVSLKVGEIMARELPDVKYLFTRTTDTYPELHARARFANENK